MNSQNRISEVVIKFHLFALNGYLYGTKGVIIWGNHGDRGL